jgi:hypothetical protein
MSTVIPSAARRRSAPRRAVDWRWLVAVALFVTVVAVELTILLAAGQPTGAFDLGSFL